MTRSEWIEFQKTATPEQIAELSKLISPHFARWEFACPCHGAEKINPQIPEICEMIREELGKPVVITSGCRCGEGTSRHLRGDAVDFACTNSVDRYKIVKWGIEHPDVISEIEVCDLHIHLGLLRAHEVVCRLEWGKSR